MDKHNYRIRCFCGECKQKRLVPIADYLDSHCKPKCQRGVSILEPNGTCKGEMVAYTEDSEDAECNALNLLCYINDSKLHKGDLGELLNTVVDDLRTHQESYETPQSMGWVDQHGRP